MIFATTQLGPLTLLRAKQDRDVHGISATLRCGPSTLYRMMLTINTRKHHLTVLVR